MMLDASQMQKSAESGVKFVVFSQIGLLQGACGLHCMTAWDHSASRKMCKRLSLLPLRTYVQLAGMTEKAR